MANETLRSERIYDGRVVSLRVDTVRYDNGREGRQEIVEHAHVIVVVPLLDENTLLLVRQFRYPVKSDLLELPAGGIDADELPEEAVRREMIEETGYRAGSIELIATFYSAPGYCDELLYLFLATDLEPGEANPEEDEDIEVVPVSLDEARNLVRSGEIRDSKSIAGIYRLLDHLSTTAK